MTDMRPLKHAVQLNPETLTDSTDPGFQFDYIDISSVTSGVVGSTSDEVFDSAPSRARRVVREGDVIVSTVRTYLRAIAGIGPDQDGAVASTGFAVLRPREDVIDSRFLRYACLSNRFVEEVVARSRGVSYPAINASELVRIGIPVPTLAEQRQVVTVLDSEVGHIESAIDKNERMLGLLDERLWARVSDTVESDGAQSVMLGRFLRVVEQGTSPVASVRPRTSPEEWAVLKLSAVTGRTSRPDEHKRLDVDPDETVRRYEVRVGDVLMTRANTPELVGDACFVESTPTRLVLPDLIYRLDYDQTKLDGRWLSWALASGRVRSQIQGLARGSSKSMVKLRGEDIKGLRLSIPPLPQQRTDAAALDAEAARVAVATERLRRRNDLLRERRQALITEAVAGQLDTAQAA